MNYYVVRPTQERFFVVRASNEKSALDALMETGLVEYCEVEIILADFDKGLMDSREYLTMSFKPNWKWNSRGNVSPIKAKAAVAGERGVTVEVEDVERL